jgi:hypothetical protein
MCLVAIYYHLEQLVWRASRAREDAQGVLRAGGGNETNCVNFPLLEALLAGLWQERRRDLRVTYTAVLSLVIALASLVVSIVVAATS